MGEMDIELGRAIDRGDEPRKPTATASSHVNVETPDIGAASCLARRYPPPWRRYLMRACNRSEPHEHLGEPCNKQGKVPPKGWMKAGDRSDDEMIAFYETIDAELERGFNLSLRIPDGAMALDSDTTDDAISHSEALEDGALVQVTPKGLHSLHRSMIAVASQARLSTASGYKFDIRTSVDGCLTVEPSIASCGAPYLWVENGPELRKILLRRGKIIDCGREKTDELLAKGYALIERDLAALAERTSGPVLPDAISSLSALPADYEQAIRDFGERTRASVDAIEKDVKRPLGMAPPSTLDEYWRTPPEEWRQIPEGERNQRIFGVLRALRGQGASDHLMHEAAFRLAAVSDPPYPDGETETVLAQACKVEPGNILSDGELADLGFVRDRSGAGRDIIEMTAQQKSDWANRKIERLLDDPDEVARRAQAAADRRAREILRRDAFSLDQLSMKRKIHSAPVAYEFLVGGLILAKSHVLISAWPGVGKSFLTVDLAICGALGESWCGGTVQKPFSTLFVPYEDDRDEFRRRIEHQANARCGPDGFVQHRAELGERIRVVDKSALSGRPLDEDMADLIATAVADDPEIRLVVFDPIGKAVSGGGTSEIEDVQRFAGVVAELNAEAGITVLSVNHINKAAHQSGEDLMSHASTGRTELVGDVRAQFQLASMNARDVTAQFPDAPAGTRGLKLQLVKANYTSLWEEPSYFLRGDGGALLERIPELTRAEADEEKLLRKIHELGAWVDQETLRRLAKADRSAGGWPPINLIGPILRRLSEAREADGEEAEGAVEPRLLMRKHLTAHRKEARDKARALDFYAPNPLPEDWPDGTSDNHYLEQFD